MKLKKIIKNLKKFQHWRRGGEGDMMEPEFIGIVIDEAIKRLEQKDDFDESAIQELRFEKMQVQSLYNTLSEIEIAGDDLSKAICKNAIERHNLDKCIHAKLLFNY